MKGLWDAFAGAFEFCSKKQLTVLFVSVLIILASLFKPVSAIQIENLLSAQTADEIHKLLTVVVKVSAMAVFFLSYLLLVVAFIESLLQKREDKDYYINKDKKDLSLKALLFKQNIGKPFFNSVVFLSFGVAACCLFDCDVINDLSFSWINNICIWLIPTILVVCSIYDGFKYVLIDRPYYIKKKQFDQLEILCKIKKNGNSQMLKNQTEDKEKYCSPITRYNSNNNVSNKNT